MSQYHNSKETETIHRFYPRLGDHSLVGFELKTAVGSSGTLHSRQSARQVERWVRFPNRFSESRWVGSLKTENFLQTCSSLRKNKSKNLKKKYHSRIREIVRQIVELRNGSNMPPLCRNQLIGKGKNV